MRYSSWEYGKSFAVVGLFVAAAFFIAERLVGVSYTYHALYVRIFLWPTSIFLPRSGEHANSPESYLLLAMAFLMNGVLYFLAGVLFGQLRRLNEGNN